MFFAKSCWDINIRGQCYGYVHCFFPVLFIFIHVRFEGNNKYAKKVLSQPWNSLTLQISLSLREKHSKIVFTLQGYFGTSDNLLRSPRIFVILDKRSELSGCFFKYYVSQLECVDLATFPFATWQIRSCLLCKFISTGACPLGFPSIFRTFRQENRIIELFYWSKFRDRKKNEIFASQAKNMQGLRHW